MKKTNILSSLAVCAAFFLTLFSSCKGGSMSDALGSSSVDYQMFSKPAEFNKWYNLVLEKFGDNKKVAQEVTMYIGRPSCEGTIQRKGEPDYLNITLSYQTPSNKKEVTDVNYFGNSTGWQSPESKAVSVRGADEESFKLEDYLFDITPVTPDVMNKVIAEALKKYKDDSKYTYQYVDNIKIDQEGIEVSIHGKLKSNDIEKSEYYKTDLNGAAK